MIRSPIEMSAGQLKKLKNGFCKDYIPLSQLFLPLNFILCYFQIICDLLKVKFDTDKDEGGDGRLKWFSGEGDWRRLPKR